MPRVDKHSTFHWTRQSDAAEICLPASTPTHYGLRLGIGSGNSVSGACDGLVAKTKARDLYRRPGPPTCITARALLANPRLSMIPRLRVQQACHELTTKLPYCAEQRQGRGLQYFCQAPWLLHHGDSPSGAILHSARLCRGVGLGRSRSSEGRRVLTALHRQDRRLSPPCLPPPQRREPRVGCRLICCLGESITTTPRGVRGLDFGFGLQRRLTNQSHRSGSSALSCPGPPELSCVSACAQHAHRNHPRFLSSFVLCSLVTPLIRSRPHFSPSCSSSFYIHRRESSPPPSPFLLKSSRVEDLSLSCAAIPVVSAPTDLCRALRSD